MATRPTVGGSDGTWGTELNVHLDVSLDDDGKVDDGAAQTTSAAPGADAELANKKYIDDQVNTKDFSAYTDEDDDSTAMLKDHAYLAATDGFVHANFVSNGSNQHITGYIDGTTDPAGAGEIMDVDFVSLTGGSGGVSFEVAAGEYFEITCGATPTIYWRSMGTLSAPVDQD